MLQQVEQLHNLIISTNDARLKELDGLVKLAAPDKEVYAMVGDGSYLILHSELVTSIQERKKVKIETSIYKSEGLRKLYKII